MRNWQTVIILFSIAITGCASSSSERLKAGKYSKRNESLSLAKNIALHTSLTKEEGPLVDVPEDVLKNTTKGASDHAVENTIDSAINTTLAVGSLLAPTAPFGYLPVSLLLSQNQLPHPALRSHFIVWMPQRLASDEKSASQFMRDRLEEAFAKALPSKYSIEDYEIKRSSLLGGDYKVSYKSLKGPDCPDRSGLECRVFIDVQKPFINTSTPDWIGSSESTYSWMNWRDGEKSRAHTISVSVYLAKHGELLSDGVLDWWLRENYNTLEIMSRHLDDWVYIYTPPFEGRPYPAFFNKGNTLYFVKPST